MGPTRWYVGLGFRHRRSPSDLHSALRMMLFSLGIGRATTGLRKFATGYNP